MLSPSKCNSQTALVLNCLREFNSHILVMLVLMLLPSSHGIGYSYSRFIGPVVGPEEKIYVPDAHNYGQQTADYIARPEYEFAYGVEDASTRVLQNRKETRDGDAVRGVYSVVDPDGTLRVVKYTADNENGFQAEVITNGIGTLHGVQHPVVGDDGNNGHYEGQQDYGNDGHTNYVQHAEQNAVKTNNDDDDDDDDNEEPEKHYEVHENDHEHEGEANDELDSDHVQYDEENYSNEDDFEDAPAGYEASRESYDADAETAEESSSEYA